MTVGHSAIRVPVGNPSLMLAVRHAVDMHHCMAIGQLGWRGFHIDAVGRAIGSGLGRMGAEEAPALLALRKK